MMAEEKPAKTIEDQPFRYRAGMGTIFTANKLNLQGDVDVKLPMHWSEDVSEETRMGWLARDVAQMASYYSAEIMPKVQNVPPWESLTFRVTK